MSRLTSYAYDLSGNIVEKSIANGTKEARTHDGRNRVSTLDNQTSGGGNIAGYAYSYDATGNVMEVEETYPSGSLSNRTITNTYDGVYRLLTEEIETTGGGTVTTDYAYDKGHNRTSRTVAGDTTTYEIGDGSNGAGANQIVSEETDGLTTTYEYDGNGNRSFRSIPPGGLEEEVSHAHESSLDDSSSSSSSPSPVNTSYAYDDENRLIALDDDETGTYAYAYDYRTRRVIRVENGTTTNLVFNGGTSIIEYTSSVGSPTVEYVRGHDYGGGVGGLEYSVRSSTPSFNFYDSRGDVTTKTNGSGTVSFQTAYEAFGNQTVTSGSTSDRQMANTKEQDPTGLLNEGFRYRDPSTGTFLTRDPLGFKAGLNNYTYVHQNPWTHFDPEGLDTWSVTSKIVGAIATAPLHASYWSDVGHNIAQGLGHAATGFAGAAYGLGQSIAHAGPAVVNGQLSSAVSAIAAHLGAATSLAAHDIGAGVHQAIQNAKTPAGFGTNIGVAATLLVGGPTASARTGGRLGTAATRAQVSDIAGTMESRGWNITGGGGRRPEEYIAPAGGGRAGGSYPDITGNKGGNTLRVNTVDTRADGVTPTTREADNAARIRSQTPGDHLLLVPKTPPVPKPAVTPTQAAGAAAAVAPNRPPPPPPKQS